MINFLQVFLSNICFCSDQKDIFVVKTHKIITKLTLNSNLKLLTCFIWLLLIFLLSRLLPSHENVYNKKYKKKCYKLFNLLLNYFKTVKYSNGKLVTKSLLKKLLNHS